MFTLLTCLKIDLDKGTVAHNEFQTLIKGMHPTIGTHFGRSHLIITFEPLKFFK